MCSHYFQDNLKWQKSGWLDQDDSFENILTLTNCKRNNYSEMESLVITGKSLKGRWLTSNERNWTAHLCRSPDSCRAVLVLKSGFWKELHEGSRSAKCWRKGFRILACNSFIYWNNIYWANMIWQKPYSISGMEMTSDSSRVPEKRAVLWGR